MMQQFKMTLGLGVLAAGLTGCAATGLSSEAFEITKAECQAAITHLSNTEPEFDGLVNSSAGWAVFPGEFSGIYWALGGAGSDGLVYNNSGEVMGYSRHARVNLGFGSLGQYSDVVIFFPTQEDMDAFQNSKFEFGGEVAAGILGLGASGQMAFTDDMEYVSDPRSAFGIGAYFTFDSYSYNDINTAMSN